MNEGKANQLFTNSAFLPTAFGEFEIKAIAQNKEDWMPHLVLIHTKIDITKPVTIRIHSECITGDLFHSSRCDCGDQLTKAMELVGQEQGMLIYLRQEGRGIGILNKLKAYNLQDEGFDTIKANTQLHLPIDARTYEIAIETLNVLGVKQIKLITNNPEKLKAFDDSGIEITQRISLNIPANPINNKYLKTKKDKMGHFFGEL